MFEGISRITARISAIQQRIAALNGQAAPPALTPNSPSYPTVSPNSSSPNSFSQNLTNAQGMPLNGGTTQLPGGLNGVTIPPASLGPLPTLPVSPGAENVVPISVTSTGDYATLIQKYAAQYGVEPALVKAVIQTESGGNPRSVSSAGAMGLMQLMPENVKESGVTDPFDPEQNIAAGTKQLAGLLTQYHGDLDMALAGYNAGPGNVRKYGGVPPFTETQNYIKRIHAAMEKE